VFVKEAILNLICIGKFCWSHILFMMVRRSLVGILKYILEISNDASLRSWFTGNLFKSVINCMGFFTL
jgi:hypothetical protein